MIAFTAAIAACATSAFAAAFSSSDNLAFLSIEAILASDAVWIASSAFSLFVSKSPGVWTPAIAATPAVLASATLSAFSADAILASSAVFAASTACSFSVRCAAVKLLSDAISAFSAAAAFSKSNFAFAF